MHTYQSTAHPHQLGWPGGEWVVKKKPMISTSFLVTFLGSNPFHALRSGKYGYR
jgi:hypothetical protein